MAKMWEPPEKVRRRKAERVNELLESLRRRCYDTIMEGGSVDITLRQEEVELPPHPRDDGFQWLEPGPETTVNITIAKPAPTREDG